MLVGGDEAFEVIGPIENDDELHGLNKLTIVRQQQVIHVETVIAGSRPVSGHAHIGANGKNILRNILHRSSDRLAKTLSIAFATHIRCQISTFT